MVSEEQFHLRRIEVEQDDLTLVFPPAGPVERCPFADCEEPVREVIVEFRYAGNLVKFPICDIHGRAIRRGLVTELSVDADGKLYSVNYQVGRHVYG